MQKNWTKYFLAFILRKELIKKLGGGNMKRRRYTAFFVISIMILAFSLACGGGENAPAGGGEASPAATKAGDTTAPAATPEVTSKGDDTTKPATTPAATPEGGDTSATKAVSPEDAKKLYLGRCKACHAEDGKGNKDLAPNAPDFTNAAWHAKEEDKELYNAIANGKGTGKGAMPKWDGLLKPEEMQSLVQYIRTLKK